MRKFLIKLKWLLAILVLLVFVATIVLNVFLAGVKSSLAKTMDRDFADRIRISSIVYIFPNTIIFNNIKVTPQGDPAADRSFAIPRMTAKLSFWDLFTKAQIIVSRLFIHKSQWDYHYFQDFVQNNFTYIMNFLRNLPDEDFQLFVKNAQIDVEQHGHLSGDLTLSYKKGGGVLADGLIRRDDVYFLISREEESIRYPKGSPLQYHLNGRIDEGAFEVRSFYLRGDNFYSKLWGALEGDVVKLKGFAFADTRPAKRQARQEPSNFPERMKYFLRGVKLLPPEDLEVADPNVYVLDIDSEFHLGYPGLKIERLWFTVNNVPINLKGDVFVSEPLAFHLAISLYPPPPEGARTPRFQHVFLDINSIWQQNTLKTTGSFSTKLVKNKYSDIAVEMIEGAFQDFSVAFKEHDRLNVGLGQGDITYRTGGNFHKISLHDVEGTVVSDGEKPRVIQVFAPFYGGRIQSEAQVETSRLPWKVTSTVDFKDVNANELNELLADFDKIYGKLYGTMIFKSYPALDLNGRINIERGILREFELFKWLGDTFDLQSLRKVNFDMASATFFVNLENFGIKDIQLESPDVRLKGYFSIDKNELVSSKVSLFFSRNLLRESVKFQPILKMFEQDIRLFNFDFQLSGDQDAMNFQWLDSDVKRRIRSRIPDFVERKIERSIEQMISPVFEEE